MSYSSALIVHLDYMRSKYLGVDQYTYGSVLALLVCKVMDDDSPQNNLNVLWREIQVYYRAHETKVQYRYLNKATMFLWQNGTPKLRGKAGEIRHFAPVLLHLWARRMNEGMLVHEQIKFLLKFSVQMEELIADNRDELAFPPGDAVKFSKACESMLTLHAVLASHFAAEDTDLFTPTSKCHMLQHISILSRSLNPRLDA